MFILEGQFMLKNPQDRRARRTAVQIKETMFSFMEKKAIHEITVSEICKACQINRATFYDHYRDVFDLVQDMEQDVLLALQELMDSVSPEEAPAVAALPPPPRGSRIICTLALPMLLAEMIT